MCRGPEKKAAQVLGGKRVGVGQHAEEEAEREEGRDTATQRRRHVSGIDLRHEVAIGEDHHRERALRHHHRQRNAQQLFKRFSAQVRQWHGLRSQ